VAYTNCVDQYQRVTTTPDLQPPEMQFVQKIYELLIGRTTSLQPFLTVCLFYNERDTDHGGVFCLENDL